MKNKRKMQEQMEKIISLKKQIKTKNLELMTAYFDFYKALGFTTEQAERMM
jgi:tRNA A37 threonylcarbamoyladenosine synthetase subunit TsaC/SUA5/YrdC